MLRVFSMKSLRPRLLGWTARKCGGSRPPAPRLLVLVTCLLTAVSTLRGAVKVESEPLDPDLGRTIESPPGWVDFEVVSDLDAASDGENAGNGLAYLLVDDRYDAATETAFVRRVTKITSADGLAQASRVQADFDPSYAKLIWHAIVVRRDGEEVSRLDPSAIEVSRRHEEMDWSVYDSTATAMLLLDDLRVGDVVDYEYSIVGSNPVFGGRVAEFRFMQWGSPVAMVVREYRMPPGRHLEVRTWSGAPEPERSRSEGSSVIRWKMEDVPGAEIDWDAPPEWDSRARVQVSEYETWKDVVDWALPLYPHRTLERDQLEAVLPLAVDDDQGLLDRADAWTRFVQEEIRYLSVAVGEGSHRPSSPVETFPRRFGDCKDKAYLLCSIFESLGIKAVPALVNTKWCAGVRDMLPSPTVFDHVVVRAELPDGRVRWLDATATHQGGGVENRAIGPYEAALPIAAGVEALESMDYAAAATDCTEILETFHSPAFDASATIEVESRYHGKAADRMRRQIATSSREELSRSFLEYYAATYPEIGAIDPYEVEDRRRDNVLILRESYRVEHFWERATDDEPFAATVFPEAVRNWIQRPGKTMRTSPYQLQHPVKIEQVTTLELPDAWSDPFEHSSVENPWFKLEITSKGLATGFTYSTSFETRRRVVAASDAATYAREADRARKALGFDLTYRPSAAEVAVESEPAVDVPAAFSPGRMVIAMGVLAGWALVFLLWALPRKTPPPLPAPGPEGIGGWLIVVLIGLIVRIFSTVGNLVAGASAYLRPGVAEAAAGGAASPLVPWMQLGLAADGVFAAGMVVNGLIVLPLFFLRHRGTRKLLIAGFVLMVLATIADAVVMGLLSAAGTGGAGTEVAQSVGRVIGVMIAAGIWIPYFVVSKRVNNTFRR